MKIEFDFEGRDEGCAFFALYAGLRMYKEVKESQIKAAAVNDQSAGSAISIPAAEAYCMLEDLKGQFPRLYWQAVVEYEDNY